MIFNSIEFAVFLPIVFCLYWPAAGTNPGRQNLILLLASYFFYGWWDWRFLALILFSSCVDYLVGLGLGTTENAAQKKLLLATSILVNLGLLFCFKYLNFFIHSFQTAFTLLGVPVSDSLTLHILLPVGISFYTFQTLSYSIDVYRGRLAPTKDPVSFFAFVAFFPQLVAGPIERAANLLPQFQKQRRFCAAEASDGLRRILWGLFQKVVVADNCAVYVNDVFLNYQTCSGSTLLLGAVFFAVQIYGDFSGYSDIAIGTARLFGFHLMRNFAFPYFSRNMAEFWRRWHISLSTWFRDYVYIPLGGSRVSPWRRVGNVFIVFGISGLWHGANWTFIFWGLVHALYLLPGMLSAGHGSVGPKGRHGKFFHACREALHMGTTFFLTVAAWIFFRSETLGHAFIYIAGIFSASLFIRPAPVPLNLCGVIIFFFAVEWIQRHKAHGLDFAHTRCTAICRWGIYYGLVLTVWQMSGTGQQFIYFQF